MRSPIFLTPIWLVVLQRCSDISKPPLSLCFFLEAMVLWILALLFCGNIQTTSTSYSRHAAVSHFFDSLDGNQDGEIDENEARLFIGESLGGSEFDTSQKVEVALDQMKLNVDGTDPYTTISKAELNQHLKRLLQVRRALGTSFRPA